MKTKEEPQRRCLACRKTSPKRELLRVVFESGRGLLIDAGKAHGRGAYVHPRPQCWRNAADRKRWEHALKIEKGALDKEQFEAFLGKLGGIILGEEKVDRPEAQPSGRKIRL